MTKRISILALAALVAAMAFTTTTTPAAHAAPRAQAGSATGDPQWPCGFFAIFQADYVEDGADGEYITIEQQRFTSIQFWKGPFDTPELVQAEVKRIASEGEWGTQWVQGHAWNTQYTKIFFRRVYNTRWKNACIS